MEQEQTEAMEADRLSAAMYHDAMQRMANEEYAEPIPAALVERVLDLVGHIEVDLDERLPDD